MNNKIKVNHFLKNNVIFVINYIILPSILIYFFSPSYIFENFVNKFEININNFSEFEISLFLSLFGSFISFMALLLAYLKIDKEKHTVSFQAFLTLFSISIVYSAFEYYLSVVYTSFLLKNFMVFTMHFYLIFKILKIFAVNEIEIFFKNINEENFIINNTIIFFSGIVTSLILLFYSLESLNFLFFKITIYISISYFIVKLLRKLKINIINHFIYKDKEFFLNKKIDINKSHYFPKNRDIFNFKIIIIFILFLFIVLFLSELKNNIVNDSLELFIKIITPTFLLYSFILIIKTHEEYKDNNMYLFFINRTINKIKKRNVSFKDIDHINNFSNFIVHDLESFINLKIALNNLISASDNIYSKSQLIAYYKILNLLILKNKKFLKEMEIKNENEINIINVLKEIKNKDLEFILDINNIKIKDIEMNEEEYSKLINIDFFIENIYKLEVEEKIINQIKKIIKSFEIINEANQIYKKGMNQ